MFGQLFARSASVSAQVVETPIAPSAMTIWPAVALALFFLLFVFRYLRTVVSIYSWNTYKPKPIKANPSFTSADITVVIPTTFKNPDELVRCLEGILRCSPAKVIIVTAEANVDRVNELIGLKSFADVECLGVSKLNKREQILRALPNVKTQFITLADDDVFWPCDNYLDYVLAMFEDPQVGAGGTRQRVQRNPQCGFWNILGISYLERRVWNNCATNAMDGSLSTLSGRTATYRASILQDPAFIWYFRNDTWRGRPLNSDDDKCLTRYVYSHGWKIALQFAEEATLETTVEDNKGYLDQCMRWARAHWRGNFTVMENESYWTPWGANGQWWGFYYIYLGQFQTPALLWDPLLLSLLVFGLRNASPFTFQMSVASFVAWIIFTKNMKMIPHFRKHPSDMKYIPLLMAFSYYHGLLNVKAVFTMTNTVWGGQDLNTLEQGRAEDPKDVVPFLRTTIKKSESYIEPTPARVLVEQTFFASGLRRRKSF